MSGLKINFSKTKISKIGPIRETDRRFCRENNLDWVSSFTALGIVYNVKNLKQITINNIENKIDSMKKLIQAWTFRNITPIGCITVAKSLILSKIIHVLQALPTPPLEYLKQIETMLINFIWRNKRHEVSKKIICQTYEMGGLNMVNIVEFDLSLKLTWIRKLLNNDSEWEEIAKENKIDRLPLTGEKHHTDILKSIHHPFWKSVVSAYIKWYKSLRTKHTIEVGNEFLWGNPMINIPFNNTLFKSNFIFVNDLFNGLGIPLSIQEIKDRIGKNLMFTTYCRLWRALPKTWKQTLRNQRKNNEVFRPITIEWLTKDRKGTKNIRKVWEPNEEPILPGKTKWIEELGLDEGESWKKIFLLPIHSKINVRCKYFQFQILHRSLITNRKLTQFGIKDNESCDNCDETETITHLLYDCHKAAEIWRAVMLWLESISPNTMFFDKNSILLGNTNNEVIVNYIILTTKHEIYKSKWNKTKLTLTKLKHIFKNQMDLEIYIGTIKNNLPKVLGKWSPVLNNLRNL